jgi:hypothetical protein
MDVTIQRCNYWMGQTLNLSHSIDVHLSNIPTVIGCGTIVSKTHTVCIDSQHIPSMYNHVYPKASIPISVSTTTSHCISHNTGLLSLIYIWTIAVMSPEPFVVCLELYPSQLHATSCSIFAVILLHLILYLLLIHSLPYSPIFNCHYHKWNLCPGR